LTISAASRCSLRSCAAVGNLERGGRTIEATYSTRNGIVTVKYRGKTLSTYSPQSDNADYKAVARQLLSVMLTI
jgi:hypothetical protein